LKGEDIPLEARILAIADAFATMTSERPYADALSVEEALEEIKKGAGKQFDPHLVEVFISIETTALLPEEKM
jgi:HD-GYP domain-containing protein (c-di-GMP phosphodiesterase class II)